MASDTQKELEEIARRLLTVIGDDPNRAGIADTPRRWAAWWMDFINHDAGATDTVFDSVNADQMVVVSGMRVWSLCEHHLLPFWCDITVAYIPDDKVMGLSKFGRIAHKCAHRLQIQERLVSEIADEIERIAETHDVAVLGRGEHLCMTMRGVRTPALMTSSVIRGRFREQEAVRNEFMQIALAGR